MKNPIHKLGGVVYRKLTRLVAPFRAAGIVLLYHRVIQLRDASMAMAISPEHFAKHLKYLKEHYKIFSLEEMIAKAKDRELPERSLALTFDDGYADNLIQAKPLLEKFGVPATMFITSGKIDSDTEFWWDDLERILLKTPKLPPQLEGVLPNGKKNWPTATREEIQTAYKDLFAICRPLAHDEIEKVLEGLCLWAQVSRKARPTHRALRSDELKSLCQGGLIQIGVHTENHASLAAHPLEVQEREIQNGRNKLEKILDRPVKGFAYPFGVREEHYKKETVALVRKLHFSYACSTMAGCMRNGQTDFYQIPRFSIGDWETGVLEQRLKDRFLS